MLNYNYGRHFDTVMLENANDFVENLLLEGRCSYELIIVEASISGNQAANYINSLRSLLSVYVPSIKQPFIVLVM